MTVEILEKLHNYVHSHASGILANIEKDAENGKEVAIEVLEKYPDKNVLLKELMIRTAQNLMAEVEQKKAKEKGNGPTH